MQHDDDLFNLAWEALKRWLPLGVLEEKLHVAQRELGRVNILVAGKTGVGKSTLINAVFGEAVSETGRGRPVTQKVAKYEPAGLPLRLWDTKGLEAEAFQETLAAVDQTVREAAESDKAEDHVHIAWLCINERSNRVEPADERLVELCQRHGLPVIVILTQSFDPDEFVADVRRLLPQVDAIVPVMAEPFRKPPVPTSGLPELVGETLRLLPEAARRAFVAAQIVDMGRKRSAALKIAAAGAASAAAAAIIPLPGLAPPAVLAATAGMVTSIAVTMGVPLQRQTLVALGTSVAGSLALTVLGRMLFGEALKLIPGVGTMVGAAADASVAAATTYGIGVAFTEFLIAFFKGHQRMPDADELRAGFSKFWRQRPVKAVEPPPAE